MTDTRLWLKCCGASCKEDCTWTPCPANLDAYTHDELRAFIAEDAHRVDDALGNHTRPGWNPPPHLPPQDTADPDDWGPHGTINDAA